METRHQYLIVLLLSLMLLMFHPASTPAFTPFPKAEGVDVFDFCENPAAYKGDVKLRGAVASVDPEKKMFTIIDYREYRACRSIACPPDWVVVIHQGKLPGKENIVEVTGTVEKNPAGRAGYVLRAKEVAVK